MSRIDKSTKPLSPRRQVVLFAVIAQYIATGRPVGSQALNKKQGLALSPATIRRELQNLTEQGFLTQPHVSAGRVPTDQAFRMFADALRSEAGHMATETQKKLVSGLSCLMPGGPQSWEEVVRLISDLSYQAALVVTPAFSEVSLRQLRFIPCGSGTLLAVIVTREGLVHNAYVDAPKTLDERDLERIHNYLSELIQGRTLNEVRKILRQELEDARKKCDALREQATVLGTQAIQSSVNRASDLVVGGRRHLLGKSDLKDRVEALMRELEEKTRLLDLLDRAVETKKKPVVIIGGEAGDRLEGCAIITSPFGSDANKGQVGIIGSMRMDYSALIPLVALAAQSLSTRLLGEEE
ncbi:MAG: heat-inducible transcriptional repressor HrcA [Myxococcota bacterium]|nr:heat-inducible transcriptional repressor HrcA [Myxococcota bacterium]